MLNSGVPDPVRHRIHKFILRQRPTHGLAISICLASIIATAAGLPPWWEAFLSVPRVQAAFLQTSESAVFGKLKRKGSVRLAKSGRLHVIYEDGLELVADGQSLIQYDPDTRTAQRMDLVAASLETPLLRLLTDPSKLGRTYAIEASGKGQVRLKHLNQSLPEIQIQGAGNLPRRLAWTDASGASQVLELLDAKVPAKDFPAGTFRFMPPKGTRWLGR